MAGCAAARWHLLDAPETHMPLRLQRHDPDQVRCSKQSQLLRGALAFLPPTAITATANLQPLAQATSLRHTGSRYDLDPHSDFHAAPRFSPSDRRCRESGSPQYSESVDLPSACWRVRATRGGCRPGYTRLTCISWHRIKTQRSCAKTLGCCFASWTNEMFRMKPGLSRVDSRTAALRTSMESEFVSLNSTRINASGRDS